MKPIVCKPVGDSLTVNITTLSGEVVSINKAAAFSCTGEEIMAIQRKSVELAKNIDAGEIILESDVHLDLLSTVYDKDREWFPKNMNLGDIKTLYKQVTDELTETQKNA